MTGLNSWTVALVLALALQEQGVARSTAELELSRVNLELGKLNRGTSQETEERKILESALETSQAEAKELRLSLKESGNEVKAYQNRVKALELKLSQSLRDVQESHVRKSEASVAPRSLYIYIYIYARRAREPCQEERGERSTTKSVP